jgi:hypothetical protein
VNFRTVASGSFAVAFVLALSAPASAQAGPAAPKPSARATRSSGGDYKGDVDGGVDLVNSVLNRGVTNTYKGGWHVGTSYRLLHVISVLAEVSADYRSVPRASPGGQVSSYTANIYAYSGGVRFMSTSKDEKVKPFAQILMGGAQDNGTGNGTINHYPTVAPGGGVDVALAKCVAARVRLDFPLYMTFGDVFKGRRLSIGVAVPFGSH